MKLSQLWTQKRVGGKWVGGWEMGPYFCLPCFIREAWLFQALLIEVFQGFTEASGRAASAGNGPCSPGEIPVRTSLGILSCHRWEMNKEPPCGHWHQVAFPLLDVSMATRQCLGPWEPGEGDPL